MPLGAALLLNQRIRIIKSCNWYSELALKMAKKILPHYQRYSPCLKVATLCEDQHTFFPAFLYGNGHAVLPQHADNRISINGPLDVTGKFLRSGWPR